MQHIPVLCGPLCDYLDIQPGDIILDGTIGLGGHSQLFLKALQTGKIFGLDQDLAAITYCQKKFENAYSVQLFHQNFSSFVDLFPQLDIQCVDKIVLDLGFSSFHLDDSNRGFTFQGTEPLDMRMDASESIHTAAFYLNSLGVRDLSDIFYHYGELFDNKILSQTIIQYRRKQKFLTTDQLIEVIKKSYRFKHRKAFIKTTTQVFQALRIYVNQELEHLKDFLNSLAQFTLPGSRIAIISFHSLEDRIVKHFLKENNNIFKPLHRGVITATEAEIQNNSRAHCAKLRCFERL